MHTNMQSVKVFCVAARSCKAKMSDWTELVDARTVRASHPNQE